MRGRRLSPPPRALVPPMPDSKTTIKLERGTVYLAPKLTVPMGAGAMAVINTIPEGIAPMQAAITGALFGPAPSGCIIAWDGPRFRRKNGEGVDEPEPITVESVERLLPWWDGGSEIAERIEELYTGDLFRPLAEKQKKQSPPTQTEPSTSPKTASGSERPKSSRRSSPNGTAGIASVVPVP